jgi:threonine synthase
MALQCMPLLFSAAIDQLRAQGSGGGVAEGVGEAVGEAACAADAIDALAAEGSEDFLILVATSGDTGKAALEGFKGCPHTNIIVFYPQDGVSDIQYRQMATQQGDNVGVFGVQGNFDNCQTAVKAVFGDEAFNRELARSYHLRFSSANSINWGRLLPQIVYYTSAYAELVRRGALLAGAELDICVPTGNFGNILGAYYARQIGVPVGRLYCASNENRVLTDFINTGVYDISQREFKLTPSPSMDILVSSNLERQLFELTGRDASAIRGWMDDLSTKGRFQIDRECFAALRENFSADWLGSDESLETIREVFETFGYLLDPHTAVAWKVAERLRGTNPVLVVSTAHWAKFSADVYRALNGLPAGSALPDDIAHLSGIELNRLLSETYGAGTGASAGAGAGMGASAGASAGVGAGAGAGMVPASLDKIDNLPIRFTQSCPGTPEGFQAAITTWLSEHRQEGRGTLA